MFQRVLARRDLIYIQHWAILASTAVGAVLVGFVVAQGLWLYLPVIALMPLLWFWPVEVVLGLLAILVPFEQIGKFGKVPALPSLALALAICVFAAVGLSRGRLARPPSTALWWGLLVCWTAGSALWAMQPALSVAHLTAVLAVFLFYLVASSFSINQKEFDALVTATILGGGAAALFSIYEFYTGMITASHQVRATLVAGETEGNPNRFAVRLLLPLSFSIARFLSARSWSARLFAACFVGITSWALFLTMSRGALLATVVLIFIFVLRLKVFRRRMTPVVVIVVLLIAFMPSGFFFRVEQSEADRGAGRLDIWIVGLTTFTHHALVGAGLGNFGIAYAEYAGYAPHFRRLTNDAHNIFLLVSVEEGIVGLLLLLIALAMQFNAASRCRRLMVKPPVMLVACEAAFCAAVVAGLFTSIIWEKSLWLSATCVALAVTLETTRVSRSSSPGMLSVS